MRPPTSAPPRSWACLLLLGTLATASVLCACDRRSDQQSAPAPSSRAVRPPAPAPAGLVAELRIPHPAAAWTALRSAAGDALPPLPASWGGLVVSQLRLPIDVVGQIDESAPLVGAVLQPAPPADDAGGPAGGLTVAWALHLRSGAGLVHQLTRGGSTHWRATEPNEVGLVTLEPTDAVHSPSWLGRLALGLLDDELLVATDAATLARAGAYLATSLAPAEPVTEPPGEDTAAERPDEVVATLWTPPATGRVVASQLGRWAAAGWQSLKLRALGALVANGELERSLATWAEPLGALRVELRKHGPHWALQLEAELAAPAWVAATRWPTLAGHELEAMPADAALAVAWTTPDDCRLAQAVDAAERALAQLRATNEPTPDKALRELARDAATGRGDVTAAGVRCSGAGLTAFATGSVAQPAGLRRAVGALRALRRNPAIVSRLTASGVRLGVRDVRLPNLARDVTSLQLTAAPPSTRPQGGSGAPAPASSALPLDPIELVVSVGERDWAASAGLEPREALLQLLAPDEGTTLGAPGSEHGAIFRSGTWLMASLDPLSLAACDRGRPLSSPAGRVRMAVGPSEPARRRVRAELQIDVSLARAVAQLWASPGSTP